MTTRELKSRSGHSEFRARTSDYLALTKPRSIHLVVSAIPAMLLAERGAIVPMPIVNALIGLAFMTAGANTLNCVADADIDKLMKRTADRPLARGSVSKAHALLFGTALSFGSVLWLSWSTTILAGLLAVATIVFYVFVYTLWIKRRSSQNVIWGGVANGMPVLIGWSAATGAVGWQALVMFGIIFFWTPPHSWALAMRHREDYRAAGIPMLPAVATEFHVARRIVTFTALTGITAIVLALGTGWVYGVVALLSSVLLLSLAYRLRERVRSGKSAQPQRLFNHANSYLTVIFLAITVDSVLALPTMFGR
ncbi:protoheme IX farnesyltransferase [Mycobacterium sp. CBMA 234]|uniref:heme o synthase n=1 Tax=Mycolicibacterium sp. CBMA 234 TaxID=1918495 RepID=UPI0012DEC345|nr:heme o synthase [Mycolicibacterium sp. CBMA 234]MUL64464.1 protoheme IX farnesyltransferase [Mycolicibacterium sp. CBMA 234]